MSAGQVNTLLESIQIRPGMFLGSIGLQQPFSAFLAFCTGYSFGRDSALRPDLNFPDELVPPGFNEFVHQHFGVVVGADTGDWTDRIREHAASEQEAFSLLFELLALFARQNPMLAESPENPRSHA